MITGGVIGIYSPKSDCLKDLYRGVLALQHRGQEYCGLSTYDGQKIRIRTHRGLVAPSFENDLPGLEGFLGIGHTSSKDRQPISRYAYNGQMTIAFDGYLTDSAQSRQELWKQGHSLSTLEDIELIASLIGGERNILKGIKKASRKISGPWSLVVLTEKGVYAARDPLGYKPLVLGQSGQQILVASETCVFNVLPGVERVRDVEPGEIVLLNREGIISLAKLGGRRKQYCSFEWIYYARPDSVIEGIPVTRVRHNLGRFLAKKETCLADIVGPVPFSGILHAEGYHLESGLPSVEVFLLPQYVKRTYIIPQVEQRKSEKDKKLTPLPANVREQRIILVDDSIRSGITSLGLVDDLRQAGAKEVHVRIASPPSIRYCPYEKPPSEEEDFIASRMGVDEIREYIGADSLIFQDLERVPEAIGLPPESLCLDCFLRENQ